MKKMNYLLVSVVFVGMLSGCLAKHALHNKTPIQRNGQVEMSESWTSVPGLPGAVTSGIAPGELNGMGTPGLYLLKQWQIQREKAFSRERLKTLNGECVAEEGTNIFGERYMMPGVVSENGNCVVLQDTAPKTVKHRVTYALLKGNIVEFKCNGYTIRIADQDSDGRVDNYDLLDYVGNIVFGIFKDPETGKVYSKSTLPRRALDGVDARPEDENILDVYNDILTDPDKFKQNFTTP